MRILKTIQVHHNSRRPQGGGEDCDFCDFPVQNSNILESNIRMYLWKRLSLRLEFGIFSTHIAIVLLINYTSVLAVGEVGKSQVSKT